MEQQTNNKGLLVISFGTSVAATRPRTLQAVEDALRDAFPERRFYRAWTSTVLRRKLEREEGQKVFSSEEALEQMALDGVTDVLVQPTHLLPGEEFRITEEAVRAFAGRFSSLKMGRPLLSEEADVASLATALEAAWPMPEGEMLALMGHGSAEMTFPVYTLLEARLKEDGFLRGCVGTVEFDPGIEPVLERVQREKPRRVHLAPLLLVAGDHAVNDMAGDEPDSWKSQIAREGAEPICHLVGLGENEAVRALYVLHARAAAPVNGEALP